MRKFLVLTGSLLLVGALAAGGWWAWPILFPSLPSQWLSTLAKVDASLVQNRPDLARIALTKVPEKLPVTGWLQWEKRVQAVAQATHAWTWATTLARVAQTQYPGNTDLTAYLVWTLLNDGKADEAWALAKKVLPGTAWDTLAVQASVEATGLAQGDWTSFRATLAEPSQQSYDAYERLVSLSDDPALRKNALLAALSRGDLEGARQHLGVLSAQQRDRPPFDRLQALMAYDQGDWSRAAALLKALPKTKPENLLVLADVYLHLGDPGQARIIYDQLLADHPDDLSVSLVVNRATLALDQNDPTTAQALVRRWTEAHPEGGQARIRLLDLEARFRLGDHEVLKAIDALASSADETELSLEAELLKDRLFPEMTSVPRLWSLVHRHPTYQPLAERLTWLLFATQDYPGATKVLDFHEAALKAAGQPLPWWTLLVRAMVLSVENQWVEAEKAYDRVPPAWRSAPFWSDWSLNAAVLAQQTDVDSRKPLLENALDRMTKALELLPPDADPQALHRRSLWLTRRGELQVALVPLEPPAQRGALRSAATEDFHQAVQLDSDNLRASFLLRQAEVTPQEKP